MNSQRTLTGVLVLVLVGIGLGIGFNVLHPKPLPWKAEAKKAGTLGDFETDSGIEPPPERTEPNHQMDPPDVQITPVEGETTQMTPAADLYADVPESEFPNEVTLAQAKALYDRGGLLVLDSRENEDYAAGHLKDAVAAPADEMMGDVEWLDRTAQDPRPIMVYCDGGDCELSLNLGFELSQSGHRKVLVFTDGFPAWKDAGYPVGTGETP